MIVTREEMERLVADRHTVSDKIRALGDAGVPRADIARFLDRKYQHVRNVLNARQRKAGGDSERDEPGQEEPDTVLQLVLANGQIKLPATWLTAEGLADGDAVICRIGRDGLHVMSRGVAIEAMREIARKRMPQEAAILEALLRDPHRPD